VRTLPKRANSHGERNLPLDGVRATAAVLIVVHHVAYAAGTTMNETYGRFTGRMDVGVPIFFVLSGYLLARPFVGSILTGTQPPSTGGFLWKRFLRIFPAYWLALIIMLIIGAVTVRGQSGFFFSFFLLHVYHPDRAISGITQSWSLATEISFYVLMPVYAAVMRRASRHRTVNQRALVLLASLVFLYLFSVAFRIIVHLLNPPFENVTPYWLPSLIDIFVLGVALAVLREWSHVNDDIRSLCHMVSAHPFLLLLLAVLTFWWVSTQFGLAVGLETSTFERETLRQGLYGLIGLFCVAPFALAEKQTRTSAVVGWRPFAWLGVVSYGIYLWHQVFISGDFAEQQMPYEIFDGGMADRLLATGSLTVVIAAVSYYLFESPLLRALSKSSFKDLLVRHWPRSTPQL
jgi:peptidoglycan/LPS O-acetylase OafA/YrhL